MDESGEIQVGGLDLEETLPESLIEAFLSRAATLHAKKGQLLLPQGSEAEDVYLIRRGKLQISMFSVNGRESILREMGAGRLVGEMAAISAMPRSASVTVVEDAHLAIMSGAAFRSFIHDVPGAGYWLAVQLASRVRNLTEKTAELATLPVSARVQSELFRLAVENGVSGDTCMIKRLPTHVELAARTGTHREAVTRELRTLAQEGIVTQNGRQLVINSIARLRAILERQTR